MVIAEPELVPVSTPVNPEWLPKFDPDADEVVVYIQPRHITMGVPGKGKRCPEALALLEMGAHNVVVKRYITIINGRTYYNSESLSSWIVRYDAWISAEPDRFVLTAEK